VGAGHSYLLTTDETWRWRFGVGERDQDRFWMNLIRHAAEDPYAARSGDWRLDLDRVWAEPRQSVSVRARRVPADAGNASAAPRLLVTRDGATIAAPLLSPQGGPGRYQGAIGDLPPGDYEVQLSAADAPAGAAPPVLPLHITEGLEQELRDVRGDPAYLRRLAESAGGQLVPLEQLASVPDRLRALEARQPQFIERPLWDGPLLYFLVLGCFGLEWALRKAFGLI
jgi:hypothetical protein